MFHNQLLLVTAEQVADLSTGLVPGVSHLAVGVLFRGRIVGSVIDSPAAVATVAIVGPERLTTRATP
jgi:hypothetical protein